MTTLSRPRPQDYEQLPQTDREQLMVHVFFYLNGLDGKVGDLMCMPRSQNAVMERPAFNQLWQDYELPGSLTFGSKNPLPPGSAGHVGPEGRRLRRDLGRTPATVSPRS